MNHPVLVLHDSGATNLDSSKTISFTQNGSADIRYQGGTTMFFGRATFIDGVRSLVRLVQQIGGPENIRIGERFASNSIDHSVWLTMGGQQSGDLTCLAPDARSVDRKIARAALKLVRQVVTMATARGVLDARPVVALTR